MGVGGKCRGCRSRATLFAFAPAVGWLRMGDLSMGSNALSLACIDDDAQGKPPRSSGTQNSTARSSADEGWANVAKLGTDDPSVFSAYLRTSALEHRHRGRPRSLPGPVPRRHSPGRLPASASQEGAAPSSRQFADRRRRRRRQDRRGGARSCANCCCVGGSTSSLSPPRPGMVRQWQDELEVKFGLTFTIIDRDYLNDPEARARLRREPMGRRLALPHLPFADVRRDLRRRPARPAAATSGRAHC